jgi:hypothetical protein
MRRMLCRSCPRINRDVWHFLIRVAVRYSDARSSTPELRTSQPMRVAPRYCRPDNAPARRGGAAR